MTKEEVIAIVAAALTKRGSMPTLPLTAYYDPKRLRNGVVSPCWDVVADYSDIHPFSFPAEAHIEVYESDGAVVFCHMI